MDYFASHEKAVQEMPGRTSVILAVAIVAVGLLLCTGLFERVKAEDGADLLLTLQVKSDQPVTAVMDGITKRAAALGAYKEGVVQIDRKTVSVRLPGYNDEIEKAVRIMEKRALLEFKLVDSKAEIAAAEKGEIPSGDEILYQMHRNPRTGQISQKPHVVKKQILMTGEAITDTRVRPGYLGSIDIHIEFNNNGTREFEKITSEHVNEKLAIILDKRVYSAPVIKARISGGAAIIEGEFSPEEADELALVLRCGPLVAPVEVVKSEWLKSPTDNR